MTAMEREAMSKFVLSALVLISSALGPLSRPLFGSIPTGSFGVTVIVQASCTTSATPGVFMAFSPSLARPKPDVSVICTDPSTPYTLDVRVGVRPATPLSDQRITGPHWGLLHYPPIPKLHMEAGRSQRNGVEAATKAANRCFRVECPQSWPAGEQSAPKSSCSEVATVTVTY
jgi:hypothetical protein